MVIERATMVRLHHLPLRGCSACRSLRVRDPVNSRALDFPEHFVTESGFISDLRGGCRARARARQIMAEEEQIVCSGTRERNLEGIISKRIDTP